MKIAVYKDNLSTGRGADRAVKNFAASLVERGHDAVLFEREALAEKLHEEWDVVVATGSNEIVDINGLGYFERPGRAKVVLQLHLAPQGFFKWKHPVRNWRIRRAFRKADAVQVLCRSYEGEFKRIAPLAHVVTIGNYTEMEAGGVRSDCSNPVILYPAAAFTRVKNQSFLIRAFASVADEFPKWGLRLLGRNDTRQGDRCRDLAHRLGVADRIEFVGFAGELAAEYARAAFLAFPSTLEGFPLALLEGANFGLCPLVHSALPGVYDIVQDGETGIVTRPTVKAYAEGLRRLMSDAGLRMAIGEGAMRFCAAHYSKEAILSKWESFLSDVADRR